MSLITCCPACGTMFRVVPDQLRISEGWVRCGHCSEVFDATASLVQGLPGAIEADTDTRPVPDPQVPAPPRPAAPMPDAPPAAAPAPLASVEVADAVEDSALDKPFVFRRSDLGHSDEAPSVTPPAPPADPARGAAPSRATVDEPSPLHDVGFIRAARRQAFWRRPFVRVLLVLAALGLAALLGLQVAVQERDRLAAYRPDARPWLEALCAPLHCTVGPPRMIDDIAIDTSAFSRLRNDAYRLSFSLRNEARVAVSMPSMELTLTDAQDQPVVRRVLSPADFAGGQRTLAAAGEWAGGVALVVTVPGGGRIAGYRLLAFYP